MRKRRLAKMMVKEVSLVDRAANGKTFHLIKRLAEEGDTLEAEANPSTREDSLTRVVGAGEALAKAAQGEPHQPGVFARMANMVEEVKKNLDLPAPTGDTLNQEDTEFLLRKIL